MVAVLKRISLMFIELSIKDAWIRIAMQVITIRAWNTGIGTRNRLFSQASGNILGSFTAVVVRTRLLM